MSALNPSLSNIKKVFTSLSYDPVLDSDAALKSWITAHNNGTFAPIINGQYHKIEEKKCFDVKNPFNGNILAKLVDSDKHLVNQAIESSVSSAKSWSSLDQTDRERIVYNMARNVQKHLNILVACESVCSGRTSREVKDLDIAQVIKTLYYYAGSSALLDLQDYSPVGTVAIFGYSDSSLLSLVNKLAAALVSGNTCLIIPHKLNPLSAFMFVDIAAESGLPSGVINVVTCQSNEIYNLVSSDSRIGCICFDGKTSTGQELIKQSSVNPWAKLLLCVEGKSSMIVYESADVDSAIETAVDGCLYSNGQHRYSLNKIFVQENIYESFLRKLECRFDKLRQGNHMDKCNDIGCLIDKNDLDKFRRALSEEASEFGAKVKTFANHAQLTPAIIENSSLNSQINLNEVNGPYVLLIPFRTVKESVQLANTSRFATAVCLYSQNISLVMEVAYLLNQPTVCINSFPIERGVQTRKQSGNYSIHGVASVKNFLLSKWQANNDAPTTSLDQVQKNVKLFGTLSADSAIPLASHLTQDKTYKLYIGGKQQRPDTQSSRQVKDFAGKSYCLVGEASRKDVRNAVEAANSAFGPWSKRSNFNKAQILYYFAEIFTQKSQLFVHKLKQLTNKSQSECEKEIKMCSHVINYFAGKCDKYVGRLNDTTEYGYLMEINEPLGVVAIVGGRGAKFSPLLNILQHLVGAIAHGNTVVLVADENMPLPSLDLYEIFDTCDMPAGVVNILTGNKHHLTKYLTEHQLVASVWYLYDQNENSQMAAYELNALQFVKYTSNYSLKKYWFVPSEVQVQDKDQTLDKKYLNEIGFNSTQPKYIHLPMGIIFAN
ncbi:Aldehyde dehydrogenase family 16 member A1 [Brachionus plicatilis]|uniref:Aldehyde dehydrogenase family 16 member A1 n=1 Tax=Brachionus plicatilis TaxID=10195 RepID=A0A3M7RNU8_BRAPC|nr:Aldehyde dehydrogenase family 16 member A1 [Brachionus plicatilis]